MIVGVDVSSHRIDLAWLENNRPCRWHQELAKGHLIDRLRSIRVQWPLAGLYDDLTWGKFVGHQAGEDVTDIAIEYPFARQTTAIAALMAVTGIITRQAPPWARVAWPSSGELRAAIGAKNTKQDAHERIRFYADWHQHYTDQPWRPALADWDEHELDALTACIGWTRILEQQDAA